MNCRRIEELIPLYVECDLETDQAGRVSAHVETCGSCSALVAEYESSQAWLRLNTLPDFDEAMLEDMKRGVMREIDEARERPSFFGFFARSLMPGRAFAAVAALLIIFAAFALYIYWGKSSAGSNDDKLANGIVVPEDVLTSDGLKQAPRADLVVQPYRVKRYPGRVYGRNRSGERPKFDRVIMPETDNTVARKTADVPIETEEMTRIEIQTGDPNIRIIWFSPKESDSQLS
ncbi:MAG TPA: zf-HC2 domain-containing protein, partial [Blastocatellia bacterium]|nr:zf-HC2 domain-containing protein [Blastocatellia bacterium]